MKQNKGRKEVQNGTKNAKKKKNTVEKKKRNQ